MKKYFLVFTLTILFINFTFAKPCILVMGYLASWSNPSGWTLDSIDWDALTHVIDTFANPAADGTISVSGMRLDALISKAHSKNTRCMFSIGGATEGYSDFASAVSSTYRSNFVNNIVNVITTYNYDGVDIDWEFPEPVDKTNFTLFMQELYNAVKASGNDYFGTPRILTFYTTTGYHDGGVDWGVIGNYCDYIIQSGYAWGNPYNAPLYYPGKYMSTEAGYSIEQSIDGFGQSLINRGVPASKFILGLPFYATPDYVKYSTAKIGVYLGYDIPQEEARYYYNGKTRYVNTATSFQKKIDYTIQKARPGIAIWEITQIYPETDLWQTIKSTVCPGPTPTPTVAPTPETEADYKIKNIKITPNPVIKGEKVSIKFKNDGYTKVRIKIFNLSGEIIKVFETKNNEILWNTATSENYLVASGIYIVTFEGIDKFGDFYNEGSLKIVIKR